MLFPTVVQYPETALSEIGLIPRMHAGEFLTVILQGTSYAMKVNQVSIYEIEGGWGQGLLVEEVRSQG